MVKDFYSVRVFELFHPREVSIKLTHPDRCRIKSSSLLLNATDQFSVVQIEGNLFRLKLHSKEYSTNELELITPSGNVFYDEYELELSHKIKRKFFGGLTIKVLENELVFLVLQKLDDLVTSVISGEASDTDPEEYLKTMSVVSRSYIISNSNRHSGYDFCDNTHCQVFYGRDATSQSFSDAVSQTSHEVIVMNNKICSALYSAVCGGHTMSPNKIWQRNEETSSISAVACSFCATSKYFHWQRSISAGDFFKAFDVHLNEVNSITIDSSNESTPTMIKINYTRGVKQINADEFRLEVGRSIGWNKILSNKFSLSLTTNRLEVTGNGFGHGVGLCQEGAKNMAKIGQNYRQIISYYFPGSTIEQMRK